jgi:hypothetical protein
MSDHVQPHPQPTLSVLDRIVARIREQGRTHGTPCRVIWRQDNAVMATHTVIVTARGQLLVDGRDATHEAEFWIEQIVTGETVRLEGATPESLGWVRQPEPNLVQRAETKPMRGVRLVLA